MGRFLSVDPENAGADPEFPQTWNAYAYVANNPLKYIDRSTANTSRRPGTVANVAIGVASLASNIKQGNYVRGHRGRSRRCSRRGRRLSHRLLPGGAGTALKIARAAR